MSLWNWLFRIGLALAAIGLLWTVWPDPGDRAYVNQRRQRSMYRKGPEVGIDLGHWNHSAADSRLLGLGDLLNWDGYRVTRLRQRFVPELLAETRVLVIAGALPYPDLLRPAAAAVGWSRRQAFTYDETATVRNWVESGGNLLLAVNMPGSAQSCATLASQFGVTFHECPSEAFFPQAEMGEHPLLAGRPWEYEQVADAAVRAGDWVEGPAAALPLLLAPPGAASFCGAGKPLALAFEFGRGRVVALAAQLERNEDLIRSTRVDPRNSGNRQLVLNAMHWLSHAWN